ncbi:MAG: hypothetical protein OXT67_13020, partial [Zetaproteobacteria bacterium]|nr:hypothetical protein [Zetaproteobacteria bacterium]
STISLSNSPNKLKSQAISNKQDCAICFEKMIHTEEIVSTACGHVFDKKCMENWIKLKVEETGSGSCPICRATIKVKSEQETDFVERATLIFKNKIATFFGSSLPITGESQESHDYVIDTREQDEIKRDMENSQALRDFAQMHLQ